jgi:hypothetical protein
MVMLQEIVLVLLNVPHVKSRRDAEFGFGGGGVGGEGGLGGEGGEGGGGDGGLGGGLGGAGAGQPPEIT